MIGLSSKEKDNFFSTTISNELLSGLLKPENDSILLTSVLWNILNRSIDPLDDGPTRGEKKMPVFINFRPAARLITGNVFPKSLKKFFEEITGDFFSNMIFFHAKILHLSLFPSNTFPGVTNTTGSSPQLPSIYSGMGIIQRANRLITPVSFLKTNSKKLDLSSVRQPGIYFFNLLLNTLIPHIIS